jgi:hypothetical protein
MRAVGWPSQTLTPPSSPTFGVGVLILPLPVMLLRHARTPRTCWYPATFDRHRRRPADCARAGRPFGSRVGFIRLPALQIGVSLAIWSSYSCGGSVVDSPGPPPPSSPRSRIVITARPTTTDYDSVLATLPGVLSFTVYDSAGHPAPRIGLAFQLIDATPMPPYPEADRLIAVRAPASQYLPGLYLTTRAALDTKTDSAGNSTATISYGRTATTVRVELRTDPVSIARPETLMFVMRPGAAAAILVSPRDSALYVGRSYTLAATVQDAHGNAIPEATARLTRSSDSTATDVSPDGVVTGRAIGRSLIRLSIDRLHDSAWISVVPPGTLAAVQQSAPGGLVQFQLDGSGFAVITPRPVAEPAWSPTGKSIAFVDKSTFEYTSGGRIMLRDAATGAETPLLSDYTPDRDWQAAPAFSGDGAQIYFAGRTILSHILRAPVGGGATDTIARPAPYPADITTPDGWYTVLTAPAATTNGRFVAYTGVASCCVDWLTYVADLTQGTRTRITGREMPKWMPGTDSLIAHAWQGFDVLRPDGTLVRHVPYPVIATIGGMRYDIAPNGRWLAVAGDVEGRRLIELVSLESGIRLPLAFTAGWSSPSWKP